VQQGTHAELLEDKGGKYAALVNAQRLNSNEDFQQVAEKSVPMDEIPSSKAEKFDQSSMPSVFSEEPLPKQERLLGSFWLFLWEQKPQWRWYSMMLLGCLGAGGESTSIWRCTLYLKMANHCRSFTSLTCIPIRKAYISL
jgi:ATP-binding cassette subfamily B (MDR/TAP) protein 1